MRIPPERRPRPIARPIGALLQARRLQEGITVAELVAELGHETSDWVDAIEQAPSLSPAALRVYHAAIARVLADRTGMRARET